MILAPIYFHKFENKKRSENESPNLLHVQNILKLNSNISI